MPLIILEGPPLDVEKKRQLARELTDVAARIYGIPHIITVIHENVTENVSDCGELICDKKR